MARRPHEKSRRGRRRRVPALEEPGEHADLDRALRDGELGGQTAELVAARTSEATRRVGHSLRRARDAEQRRQGERGRRGVGHGELRILWGLLRAGVNDEGVGRFDVLWGLVRLSHEAGGRWVLRLVWGLVQLVLDADFTGFFSVVWGLFRIGRDRDGAWGLRLCWGLVRLSTGRRTRLVRSAGRDDPYHEALAQPRRRISARERRRQREALPREPAPPTPPTPAVAPPPPVSAQEPAPRQEQPAAGVASDQARELHNLSASIAHEIRNPVTAAMSLVQQMGEDPGSDENVEYAKVALDELERVERSVSHLLRFAREEEMQTDELSLAETVRSAVGVVTARATEAGVEIKSEIEGEGRILGDAEKLRRVTLNLLNNALDAVIESQTPAPRVTIGLGQNLAGSEVWLRVSDNGPGIDAEKRDQIFTPFHTSKESGTGLGLSITRKLVQAHGGSIELMPGTGGADFLITLPKRLGLGLG